METPNINIFDKNFIIYDLSSTFGKSPKNFTYIKNLKTFACLENRVDMISNSDILDMWKEF